MASKRKKQSAPPPTPPPTPLPTVSAQAPEYASLANQLAQLTSAQQQQVTAMQQQQAQEQQSTNSIIEQLRLQLAEQRASAESNLKTYQELQSKTAANEVQTQNQAEAAAARQQDAQRRQSMIARGALRRTFSASRNTVY